MGLTCVSILLAFVVATRAQIYQSVTVTVKTSNLPASQCINDGYVILYGPGGHESSKLMLEKGGFSQGALDSFNFTVSELLLPVKSVLLGNADNVPPLHDGWRVDYVQVSSTDYSQQFACNMWLDADANDYKTERLLVEDCASIPSGYHLTVIVKTGTVTYAESTNRGYVILTGPDNRSSGKIILEKPGGFKAGSTETFNIKVPELLSPVCTVVIGNTNEPDKDEGWFVDGVTIQSRDTSLQQYFPLGKWLDTEPGDVMEHTLVEDPMKRLRL